MERAAFGSGESLGLTLGALAMLPAGLWGGLFGPGWLGWFGAGALVPLFLAGADVGENEKEGRLNPKSGCLAVV